MIAGHLFLTLLEGQGTIENVHITAAVVFLQIILLVQEFSFAVIQSYVFMTLMTLCNRIMNQLKHPYHLVNI